VIFQVVLAVKLFHVLGMLVSIITGTFCQKRGITGNLPPFLIVGRLAGFAPGMTVSMARTTTTTKPYSHLPSDKGSGPVSAGPPRRK